MFPTEKPLSWTWASLRRSASATHQLKRRRANAVQLDVTPLEQRTLLSLAPTPIGRVEDRLRQLAAERIQTKSKQPSGILKAVEAVNSTTIHVQFKTPVKPRLASKLRYEIAGLQVVSITLDKNRRGATLKTAPQGSDAYTVKVYVAGGKAGAAKHGAATLQGKPAPRILDIKPISDTMILVTYDRPMGKEAINPANYTLTNQTAQPAQILSASYVGNSASLVSLQTTPQTFGTYSFNVNNISDTYGQQVFFEGRKLLTGNPKGAVVSAGAPNPTTVVVVFNEAMADNALAPHHYSIKDTNGKPLLVTKVRFDGPLTQVVILTTEAQQKVAYQLTASQNITDLNNDPLAAATTTATFQGIASPALSAAVATDAGSVVLTFTGPVGDSALSPSTYKIDKLDAQGNGIGSLPITAAAFVGGQRTVVVLATPTQEDGRYRITTTGTLTDVAGSPLPPVQVEFQGIGVQPKLVSVAPNGANTILLTFSQPMSDDALSPSSYVIKDANGVVLPVLSAQFIGTEQRIVQLTTGPQNGGVYTIVSITATDINGNQVGPITGPVGGFQGAPATSLIKAIPTDSTHVVLTFGSAVGDSALAPSSYKIDKLDAQGNVIGSLPIIAAAFVGGDHTVVELTTPTQEPVRYRIATTNALTNAAGSPLAVSQLEFQGIGSQPTLVSVTSVGPNTVLLTFSEAMSDDALTPISYSITTASGAPLRVLGALFAGTQRRIVELTTETQASVLYKVVSITATDLGGSPSIVPSSPVINTFPGQGIPSEAPEIAGPPRVVGAGSLSNTELIVVFSEPMASSAIDMKNYIITQVSENPAAGTLRVTGAEFYLGNPSVVKLTTFSQNELSYKVTVINATDRAGNPLAPKVTNGGDAIDPTSGVFPGSPPNAATQKDTDGDGLLDSEESRGWTVTIVLANGTIIERGVTSDPTLADTDGDGVPDPAELSVHSDPRGADTDVDGLPDLVELRDNLGDPNKQDTDGDGLNDLTEKVGWTINVTLGDGSVVTQQVTSNPYLSDTDFDGLIDRLERILLVNPTNPDSDGDGASDGQEVSDGKNPTTNNPTDKVPDSKELPRVTGAASQGNTSLLVAFSKPMDESALNPGNYIIVQTNVNPEPGVLLLADGPDADLAPDIVWANAEHTAVLLTTYPQNELTYTVTAVNVRDTSGNPLAPPVPVAGMLINLSSVNFPGTPASGGQVDTDEDGLSDNVEMRGWFVTVENADGTTTTRGITSDPNVADTDGDELNDAQEANLRFDPRAIDSDDDQINDYAEFNELYSNGLDQDTDGDTLDDFLEFAFFLTSPLFADTDGDQIDDAIEVSLGGYRNARVADLPRPEIEVEEVVNLQIDVRFVETKNNVRRELETKSLNSSLKRSESQKYTRSDTVNVEAHLNFEVGIEAGDYTILAKPGGSIGYSFQQTSESQAETESTYERSLSTDKEVTKGATLEREVHGAIMQVAVNLRNVSTLAYRVKNLQVTAFIQDPQNHARITPVATLLPDAEPEEGFTLGPFVTNRGPLIFSNSTIIPSLVDSLMANSSGLIFRISNYDIIDENGRNFAFTSQDVADRTARLGIDFGGARNLRATATGQQIDENQPGEEAEIFRISTGAGRAIDDTNDDGTVDENDRRVTFDAVGKQVGITLFDAMSAAYFTRFEARLDPDTGKFLEYEPDGTTPIDFTNQDDLYLNSYSTFVDALGREKIHRIRGVANDSIIQKFWEILTPLGVDRVTELNNLILTANAAASLNFVQDLDKDGLTADVEFLLRTSDSPEAVSATDPTPKGRDTDRDGLDDRFEALIGWRVDTPQRSFQVYSSPNRADSNFDSPKPGVDSDIDNVEDRLEYDGSDTFAAPARWVDTNNNGLRDRFETSRENDSDYLLDPVHRDTDEDGITDATELIGFRITRIENGESQLIAGTKPLTPFTDSDTFSDGLERQIGLDPTNGSDTDEDGDGLPDVVENTGWDVTIIDKSTSPYVQGMAHTLPRAQTRSSTASVDSDNDGLTDLDEFFLATNPNSTDTDNDGIEDRIELLGFVLGHKVGTEELGIIVTDPLDADTDNDKRSDGAEAELVDIELARWVVRPDGETPYQAFSNPLVADADFDLLVDGDEFSVGSDPNNGNTDGDARDDGKEFTGGTNPLVEDFQVTVFVTSLTITQDGDDGDNPGDFGFDIGIRKPDSSQPAGLSSFLTSIVRESARLNSPFDSSITGERTIEPFLPPLGPGETQQSLHDNGAGIYGINIGEDTLRFPGLIPQSMRSQPFGMTVNDFFAIEGVIIELDNGDLNELTKVYLGGIEGVQAQEAAEDSKGNPILNTIRPVFYGFDLLASPDRFHELTFTFTTDDNFEGKPGSGRIAGSVSMFFLVS